MTIENLDKNMAIDFLFPKIAQFNLAPNETLLTAN